MRRQFLIVQKDPFLRRKLKKTLEKSGRFVVDSTGSRDQCLELCRRYRPDMIFLQPAPPPDKEGVALIQALRRESGTVQIVMFGKYDEQEMNMIHGYLLAGAADFLTDRFLKKERKEQLLDAVEWLERSPRLSFREQGKGKRVLVQHSNLAIRAGLNYLLQESGYEVMGLCTEYFQSYYICQNTVFKPDLLIADDPRAVRAFRDDDPSLPILVCSSRANEQFVVECITLGAKDFLAIPFDNNELLKRVRVLCELSGARREAPCMSDAEEVPETPEPPSAPEEKPTPEELLAEIERVAGIKGSDVIARVVVAQKSRFMLTLLRDALEKNRCTVAGETTEGWRCLELYRETRPDLVILDTVLADDQDGVTILRLLKKEDPEVLVLMTGTGEPDTLAACREGGAENFLLKPFTAETVRQEVFDTVRKGLIARSGR